MTPKIFCRGVMDCEVEIRLCYLRAVVKRPVGRGVIMKAKTKVKAGLIGLL